MHHHNRALVTLDGAIGDRLRIRRAPWGVCALCIGGQMPIILNGIIDDRRQMSGQAFYEPLSLYPAWAYGSFRSVSLDASMILKGVTGGETTARARARDYR